MCLCSAECHCECESFKSLLICVLFLVMSHISCVTVLGCVSAECGVECIKCQVSCPIICVLSCPIVCVVSLYCDVSLRSVGVGVMCVRRNVTTHGHTSDCP